MARAGILYSQVARAAASLAAAGTNPTVDAVRAALGGTGSKSTIAPMLKQWKHEHQGEATAAASGLPVDLLEAVQAVHQRIEARAADQIAQARSAWEADKAQLTEQLVVASDVAKALRAERDGLSKELQDTQAALTHSDADRQQGAVQLASLQAEKAGLDQRLADRAAEVKQLTDQLAHTREQFEHYQEATAAQREQDRQAYEARIAALEHEARQLRTYVQEHQQAVVVLRTERDGLKEHLDKLSAESKEQLGQVYTLREQLAAAREMASREHMEAEMTAARLGDANHEIVRMRGRIAALEDENALLRKKIDAPANTPAGSGRSKKA